MTIYSIASRCGVSAATVSRALSKPELVSDALRERILHTAEEMGYRVNRNARRLARGISGLVAVVVPDITNPYFPPLIKALGASLEAEGSSLLMTDSSNSADRECALIRRLAGDVDGFILVSPRASLSALQAELTQSRVVLIHRPARTLNHVLIDESAAIDHAVELLAASGRSRVAYVGGPSNSWVNSRRRTLLRASLATRGLDLTDLGDHEATIDSGQHAAAAVVVAAADAVVAFDDVLALGVIDGLTEHGKHVPDDVGVVAFDNLDQSAIVRPSISSIAADPGQIAAAAARILGASAPGQLRAISDSVEATLHIRASIPQG